MHTCLSHLRNSIAVFGPSGASADAPLLFGLENDGTTVRCWLNTACMLMMNGSGQAAFWQTQAPYKGPRPDVAEPLSYEDACKLLYWELVDLFHSLRQASGSTMKILIVLGKAHPSLAECDELGHHQQQDLDEAFNLMMPMLELGMPLAGVGMQEAKAFLNLFHFNLAWHLACCNPDCTYTSCRLLAPAYKLQVPLNGTIKSLEAGIAAALDKEVLSEWVCKDLDDCVDCMAGRQHSKHCRGSGGVAGNLLADHGQVLVLSLNRFKADLTKITRPVSFPLVLHLEQHCAPGLKERSGGKFRLKGVLAHNGEAMHSGHYYGAFQQPSQQWLLFDDAIVTPIAQSTVLSMTRLAYMLVYEATPDYESRTMLGLLSSTDSDSSSAAAPSTPAGQETMARNCSATSTPVWTPVSAADDHWPDQQPNNQGSDGQTAVIESRARLQLSAVLQTLCLSLLKKVFAETSKASKNSSQPSREHMASQHEQHRLNAAQDTGEVEDNPVLMPEPLAKPHLQQLQQLLLGEQLSGNVKLLGSEQPSTYDQPESISEPEVLDSKTPKPATGVAGPHARDRQKGKADGHKDKEPAGRLDAVADRLYFAAGAATGISLGVARALRAWWDA